MLTVQSRQMRSEQLLSFLGFPQGLRTYVPAPQLSKSECSELVNWNIKADGQFVTRDPISKYTTTAANSAIKTIAHVNIGSTIYTLIQDANYVVYYLDTDPKPVAIDTLTAWAQIIGYNGVAILMDGSYLKYIDDLSGIKICYDDGTGATGYQYNNTCGNNEASTAMYSGSVTRCGSKVTTLGWDTGYTIPITSIEAWLSKTGSPTGNITATLYNSDGSVLLQTSTTTIDASTLTGNAAKYTFLFGNTYQLQPATAYFFIVEYSGGDASNYVSLHASSVTSGGKQEQYAGSWSAIATKNPLIGVKPGRPPKGSSGEVKDQRLILQGDPDNPGYVWYSNLTHLDWSTPNGGGYIGVVDDHKDSYQVGGLGVLYGDLFVYGTEAQPYLAKLTGSDPSDYALPLTFQRTWTTNKTVVNCINDLWAGSGDGVDALSGVQEYGDYRTFSHSDPVKDRIDDYWDSDTAFAAYYAKEGQYWLVMPSYHRVLISRTKRPVQDVSGTGARYPWMEHEYYRDIFTRAAYKWTASGTEYYLEAAAGGDPSIATKPDFLTLDGEVITEGTAGSLSDHEWDYALDPTSTFYTVYLRDDSGDPDTSGVEVRSILLPTALGQAGSNFLLGGSDGFLYKIDNSQHLELGLHQIKPKIASAYVDIPFGHVNFRQFNILASSGGTGTIGIDFFKDGNMTTAVVEKSLSVALSSSQPYKWLNFNAYAIMFKINDITLSDYPIRFSGLLLKYRPLTR